MVLCGCTGDNADHRPCDSMQSVPREIKYDAALDTLIITPVAEVAGLREALVKRVWHTLLALFAPSTSSECMHCLRCIS